ncbi:MAG: arylesterase [Betaproteobacteria bacterium]|nr:MAG: arylesterase [Betaproteobacteria bacterium]
MATASPGMTLSEMSCKITNSFAPGEPFAAFSFSRTTFESPVARTMGWEKSGMRSILFGALLACCGTAAAAPTILVYGDSLSSAYGIPQSAGWVALLGERLKQLKSNYTVVNASVSGETSAGGAARIGRVLASTRPAIVIVELGANDGLRGLPVAQMKANLTAIVRAAKRQGARVILVGMQMPPNYGAQYTNAFRAAFREVARDERVPLVPFLLEGLDKREMFQPDNLHPVAEAQPLLLENVWRKLASMVIARAK